MGRYYFKKYTALAQYYAADIQSEAHVTGNVWSPPYFREYRVDINNGFTLVRQYGVTGVSFDYVNLYQYINASTLNVIYGRYEDSNVFHQTAILHMPPRYVANKYLGEVTAFEDELPENGYCAADGYYYVRDRLATTMNCMVDGVWQVCRPYVLVGGVWTASEYATLMDGVWH